MVPRAGGIAAGLSVKLFPSACRRCGTPMINISRLAVCEPCLWAHQPGAGRFCSLCGDRLPGVFAFCAEVRGFRPGEAGCRLYRRPQPLGLSRRERRENTHDGFKVAEPEDVAGRSILLVNGLRTGGLRPARQLQNVDAFCPGPGRQKTCIAPVALVFKSEARPTMAAAGYESRPSAVV